MAKPQTTRLREKDEPIAGGVRIIDVQYTVVRDPHAPRKRSGWFRAVRLYFFALIVAAALGFIIPPLFVLVGELTR